MRITNASGVRNDLLQEIADATGNQFGLATYLEISMANASLLSSHSLTTRASYTVPVAKRALVSGIATNIIRNVVATTVGTAIIRFRILRSGGSTLNVYYHAFTSNTVEDSTSLNMAMNYHLAAGDYIEITTEDPSTGGNHVYSYNAAVEEFDI
jgi:hypothetical protein